MTDIAKETVNTAVNCHGYNNNSQMENDERIVETSLHSSFEFRPSQKSGNDKKGLRSKSPGAFIERLSSFARGKYRSSLSEKSSSSKILDELPKRVFLFYFILKIFVLQYFRSDA